MYTVDVSKDLSYAIDIIEEILNSKDGDSFVDSIRNYKQTKEVDDIGLMQLKKFC